MKLHFDGQHIQQLLALSENAQQRLGAPMHMVQTAFLRDDIDPQRLENLLANVDDFGMNPDVKPNEIDTQKIPVGLFLMADDGVFLKSQASGLEAEQAQCANVAWPKECDPDKTDFDTRWSIQNACFGSQISVEFLLKEQLLPILERDVDVVITLTPHSMAFAFPKR